MKLTMLYENKDGPGFYRVTLTTRLNEHLLGSPYPPNKDGKEQFLHKNSRAETIADAWYYAAWQNPRFFDKFKMFEIPQSVFGERMISNTVSLFDTTTDNNYTITDDGRCNLFAGTNLFARQQELGNFSNNFKSGNSDGCNNYIVL